MTVGELIEQISNNRCPNDLPIFLEQEYEPVLLEFVHYCYGDEGTEDEPYLSFKGETGMSDYQWKEQLELNFEESQ